ncbi:MAG: double-strand break repair protein AddB, partial [Alphaproteobacteria bacterium]|nr:double-strand break repair protein AddB [Alphaproteobacteria bacterium]
MGTVYTIPPGAPFLDELAAGITAREGDTPLGLAGITVLLPTRRACRALTEAFLRTGGGRPMMLPTVRPLGDVDDAELVLTAASHGGDDALAILRLPPPVPALRRQLLLTRLILASAGAEPERDAGDGLDPAKATHLAAALAALLDEIQIEGCDLGALDHLVPAEYAAHWQETLDFLAILTEHWPRILAEEGCLDPAIHRNARLRALAEQWRAVPPERSVIAAGSTGSVPATAELLRAIATLPNGAVVLPGLDPTLDDAAWAAIDAGHSQAGLKQLIEGLGLARGDIAPWHATLGEPSERVRLVGRALRPAEAPPLPPEPPAPDALSGLTWIDCASPHQEAGVIAILLREALERPNETAALVTADRDLARRVATELARWDIAIDDSAGVPLAQTPPGVFLRLTAALAAAGAAPVPLLAALKHPLATAGLPAGLFRARVRRLERKLLRGLRPARDLSGLIEALRA